jgi:hypothetical protein
MVTYNEPARISAYEAISEAQRLAFAPIAFQATRTLIRLGILKAVADAGERGARADELRERLNMSEYALRVLLDMGLSIGAVWKNEDRYVLDKIGYVLLTDRMTHINMNFVANVCYEAMAKLEESVTVGSPSGLRRFGDWPTVYRGLTDLPEPARTSWFEFDHFYSTNAFPKALDIVFVERPRHILDVGGNIGLWALACARRDAAVRITIIDLPEQIHAARQTLAGTEHEARIDFYAADLLDPERELPIGADTIWMSQFLDCFSEAQIGSILARVANIMDEHTSLFILETLWDRQRHEAAAFSLNATSLYFTCIANGVSRMYSSTDLLLLIETAGLRVEAQHDDLGLGHTLLHCVKRSSNRGAAQ